MVDLIAENRTMVATDPEQVKEAVKSCYQESPTEFMSFRLYDIGAYPDPPICSKLVWRIAKPWTITTEEEAAVIKTIQDSARKPHKSFDEELLSLLNPQTPRKNATKEEKRETV